MALLRRVFKNPKLYMVYLWGRIVQGSEAADRKYLERLYYTVFKEKCNLDDPKGFNEKIQWLKLYDRNPQYTSMVDKYDVRKIIEEAIGEKYLIPLIGVWNKLEEISFEQLPKQFVLKCTHDSGGVFIVKNRDEADFGGIKKSIYRNLKKNYFLNNREWPYKNIKPRIIAEKYTVDESGYELKDYKIFVFNGTAKYIQVDYDRFVDHHRNFYDREWHYIPFTTMYPTNPNRVINCPLFLEEMLLIAERIAEVANTPPFIRVDLYHTLDGIKFGEVTFYHGSGFEPFYPKEFDRKLGDLMQLGSTV